MKCFLELGLPLIFQYNCPCSGPHHLSLLCNKLPGGTLNFVSIIYSSPAVSSTFLNQGGGSV